MKLVDVQKAAESISPYIQKTPLVHIEETSTFLKCEHLQVTSSFKARGAFNTLLVLSEEEKKRGVITRSAGNFAKALSYAGQLLNIPIVSEEEIIQAMQFLYHKHGMIVEPSGAVSVAAFLFNPHLMLSGHVVCVISGGNVDLDRFYHWI